MKVKAYSILELLVVLVIITIVAALLLPALSRAKGKAGEVRCYSNLKQLHLAILIYQENYGGSGTFGNLYEMHLPTQPLPRTLKISLGLRECSGDAKEVSTPEFFPYYYIPVPPGQRTGRVLWEAYAAENQENSLLLLDLNHNPKGTPYLAEGLTRKGIGITLGGSLLLRTKKGDWWNYDWWK